MLAFPPSSSWGPGLTCTLPTRKSFERCATLILPRLYLSDLATAKQEATLLELGITHVISAMEYAPNLPQSIPDERRLHVNIADRPDANVLQHLDETTEYIRQVLSESPENKVLVGRMPQSRTSSLNNPRCIVFKELVAVPQLSARISSPRRAVR